MLQRDPDAIPKYVLDEDEQHSRYARWKDVLEELLGGAEPLGDRSVFQTERTSRLGRRRRR